MAINQNTLTITKADPSSTKPIGKLEAYWEGSVNDAATTYLPSSLGIWVDPGASSADATDTYYSKEITLVPLDGMELSVPSSADAQVKFTWQWYNASGESFNGSARAVPGTAAELTGGTWTDIGSGYANTAGTEALAKYNNAEEDIFYYGSKFRVKIVVTDAGSDGVSAGIIDTAVAALNHVGTGAHIVIGSIDKQAKKNASLSGSAIGGDGDTGIGQDPSRN